MKIRICHGLSSKDQEKVLKLFDDMQKEYGDPPKRNIGLMLIPDSEETEDVFYLLGEEDDKLVSFVSVFCPDGEYAEITGFTPFEHRHKGYFTELLDLAEEAAEELFGDVDFVYEAATDDPDTLHFLTESELSVVKSECMMQDMASEPAKALGPLVNLSAPLTQECLPAMVPIMEACFPEYFQIAEGYLSDVLANKATKSYFICLPDGTRIGLVHLTFSDSVVYLSGLGILPEYRRNHYAEESICRIRQMLAPDQVLTLQVTRQNEPAFRLYEKLGFQITQQIDFYMA